MSLRKSQSGDSGPRRNRIQSAVFLSAALCVCTVCACFAQEKPLPTLPETSHLAFVTEYIRELAENEDTRESVEKDMQKAAKEGKTTTQMLEGIHGSTLIQLRLRAQIKVLQAMRLNTPNDELIPDIIKFYEHKIALHQQMIDISTAFLGGPKANVDYGELAAEMPKIRASLEDADKTMYENATTWAFYTLIDERTDSKNHMSHLIITRAERATLLANLTRDFGPKLNQKEPYFAVGAAQILKAALQKPFKCSDDPWE
jgi:hypothetical protein